MDYVLAVKQIHMSCYTYNIILKLFILVKI